MYLVDTSVWLDFFHAHVTEPVSRFENILDGNLPFGITSLIFQEVLQGAKSEKDFSRLTTYLSTQRFYHPLDPVTSYQQAAHLYFRCRREGVTIRSTGDCLIAQIAIEHNLQLLHDDQDFVRMAKVVAALRLA